MRLRVHTILSGRYWKAGEEIPDEDVPPNIRKYALSSAEPVPRFGKHAEQPDRRPLPFCPASSANPRTWRSMRNSTGAPLSQGTTGMKSVDPPH